LPAADDLVQHLAGIVAEQLALADRQIDDPIPADALLGNADVALVIEQPVPRVDIGRHGAWYKLVGVEYLPAVPAACSAEQRAEVIADDVEDLECDSLVVTALELQSHPAVIAVPEFAELLKSAVDRLVEGARRDAREGPRRQR